MLRRTLVRFESMQLLLKQVVVRGTRTTEVQCYLPGKIELPSQRPFPCLDIKTGQQLLCNFLNVPAPQRSFQDRISYRLLK